MDISAFWQFDFLRRALEAGLLIGIVAPLLGIFLVVRRYSLFRTPCRMCHFLVLLWRLS
ncbi:MAG: 3 transport family [Patescibacteria group bacterium]|nr:3 transport family [Patescibacteria group bacterium]